MRNRGILIERKQKTFSAPPFDISRFSRYPLAAALGSEVRINNGHLYCEVGKKEQAPARAIFVQGSLWVWSAD